METIIFGNAHPYHENSFSWIVGAFDDAKLAKELVDKLNKVNSEYYLRWHDPEFRRKFVEPYAWFTQDALDELVALHPRSVPPQSKLEDVGSDITLKFSYYTLGSGWSDTESE
jgi:hypothetical protein